ncbi:hypothetical protein CQW23_21479 [Capsicum baccatum]|uniref:Uncharacterized protein n=1 Tax=Capsicum baccatum TaxID=33114 RepID=A0A2G2VY50_CAPBA|nr:hypothetical protein CQW23_21479 [Capsicum baccatum]
MTIPYSMRTQPKPTLDASQYTMKPSESSGRAKTGAEMVCMIMLSAEIDQNIIYEYYDEHVQVLLELPVLQVHESGWGISKTKGHDQKHKVTIPSMKGSLWNVTSSDSELMVA